jgi:hypothetical protein
VGLRQSKRSQINADEFVSAAGEKRPHAHVAGLPERWPPDDDRHQRFSPHHRRCGDQAGDPYEKIPAVPHCCSAAAVVDRHFTLWYPSVAGLTRPAPPSSVLQWCYSEVFAMAAAVRKRDIAIRVMVTAKEQAELRKAANRAALPMSVYVRMKALEAARA